MFFLHFTVQHCSRACRHVEFEQASNQSMFLFYNFGSSLSVQDLSVFVPER